MRQSKEVMLQPLAVLSSNSVSYIRIRTRETSRGGASRDSRNTTRKKTQFKKLKKLLRSDTMCNHYE